MAAKILVVDDSPTIIEIFKKNLEQEQHTVFVSYDGKNLIEIIEQNDIDIILLDIVLPETNGFDVLKTLQAAPETRDIPVIMITSLTDAKNVKKALDCGALDYIRKPFEPIELIARINSALRIKEKQIQLHELVIRDALTNLYNRRFFNTTIEQIIQSRDSYNNGIAFVMLDCDFFKKINDTFGHTTGDDVLIAVSDAIKHSIRSTDIAYRYGGEEFCLVFPNTSRLQAYAITERMRENVEQIPFNFQDQNINITISCGISHISSGEDKSVTALINEADTALYNAKTNGRNRIEYYAATN